MALNTLRQNDSVEQKSNLPEWFGEDLELFKNAQDKPEAKSVIRNLEHEDSIDVITDAETEDLFKTLNAKVENKPETIPEISEESEIINIVEKLPKVGKAVERESLFTSDESQESKDALENGPDNVVADISNKNPASSAALLLSHNPGLVAELAAYKQGIVEEFSDVFSNMAYNDNFVNNINLA